MKQEIELIKEVFKFEEMNFDYINDQLRGLVLELHNKDQHLGYINEKIENLKRQFDSVIDNFQNRIKVKQLQQEFLKQIENKKW